MPSKPDFSAGENIAMKVPAHEYDATVSFYRDILGFRQLENHAADDEHSVIFEFGDKKLWVDRVNGLSQAEIWLEIVTDDVQAASEYLSAANVTRRDGIETLPDGFSGFWLANPANIIHLVSG